MQDILRNLLISYKIFKRHERKYNRSQNILIENMLLDRISEAERAV